MDGAILKELRKQKNLTQRELSKEINVSESAIRMIELGKRKGSDEIENKIADYFCVTLDYLNGREKKQNKLVDANIVDEILDSLISEGIITDPDNIDKETYDIIMKTVSAQIAIKLKKHEKGDNKCV